MAARLPLLLLFALPLANGHCYSHNTQTYTGYGLAWFGCRKGPA